MLGKSLRVRNMQKILIDTNVILRYLLNDVEEMAKKSEDEIEHKKTVI